MNRQVFPKFKFSLKTKLMLKFQQQPTPLPDCFYARAALER